jgi:hypothetical protein
VMRLRVHTLRYPLIRLPLSPGLIPAAICIIRSHVASFAAFGDSSTAALDVAFLAYVACCAGKRSLSIPHIITPPPSLPLLGDTSASEIGILSSSRPRLITTGRCVPPGTNGAVTLLGTIASAAAGAAVGVSFGVCELLLDGRRVALANAACVGALAGLCGSIVDSVLGATLQYSALEANGKRVLSSKADAEASHGSRHISGRDVLSNAQVGQRCRCALVIAQLLTPSHRSTLLRLALRAWYLRWQQRKRQHIERARVNVLMSDALALRLQCSAINCTSQHRIHDTWSDFCILPHTARSNARSQNGTRETCQACYLQMAARYTESTRHGMSNARHTVLNSRSTPLR